MCGRLKKAANHGGGGQAWQPGRERHHELAYRLYNLCERKKRAAEALSYNALVQSWPEIVRLAETGHTQASDLMKKRTLMAITNYDRVGKGLELLRDGLRPFVERFHAQYGKYWITTTTCSWRDEMTFRDGDDSPNLDAALILRLMWEQWNDVFRKTLGHAERSLVSELRDVRNNWSRRSRYPATTPTVR